MWPYENNNDNDNGDDGSDDDGGGNEGYNIEIIIIVLIVNDLYTVHHTISHHSSVNRSLHVFITKSILNDRQSFLAYNKKQ